ncbi:MAG TPA: DUF5666 domain-containing protein, partial [Blastocatellia bacterium]|nr:DUF5666 domain-containing protein [Blastocatellia bacterium]
LKGGTITVLNKVLQITDPTSFPSSANGKSLAELEVGRWVSVRLRSADNLPIALEVGQLPRDFDPKPPKGGGPPLIIEGVVGSVRGNILEAAGVYRFDISKAEILSFIDGGVLSADSITSGENFVAWVNRPTGPLATLQCNWIFLQPGNEAELSGSLQAVDLNAKKITVLSRAITVTDETSFLFPEGVRSIDGLKVGERVTVAFRFVNNRRVATRLRGKGVMTWIASSIGAIRRATIFIRPSMT